MKRHKWEPEHDNALWAAVEACEPLFDLYKGSQNKRYSEGNAWDAVAGRLLPDVHVTGSAAATRWRTLVEQRREAESEVLEVVAGTPEDLARDRWEDVILTVEQYEESTLERVDDMVMRCHERLDVLCHIVDRLARELGVEETWEVGAPATAGDPGCDRCGGKPADHIGQGLKR